MDFLFRFIFRNKLVIPLDVRRPAGAGQTGGVFPVLAALRTNAARFKRIPETTTARLAQPTVGRLRNPHTFWTKYFYVSHNSPLKALSRMGGSKASSSAAVSACRRLSESPQRSENLAQLRLIEIFILRINDSLRHKTTTALEVTGNSAALNETSRKSNAEKK